ncbi:hypothetical protein POM88_020963 [Heracleum sosnowskyi]|uniref:Uncharacterized protein n=1 Tax=Heracleum sosnowskyi TaxID=360622 RepID=A0AAD8IDM0_9APIA|nr:hypothetical protein POM88_020963 [Heracleum sosnowskyi]
MLGRCCTILFAQLNTTKILIRPKQNKLSKKKKRNLTTNKRAMTMSKTTHCWVTVIVIFMMIMVSQPSVVHSRKLLHSTTSATKHEETAVSKNTNQYFSADTRVPASSGSSKNAKDNPVGDGQVYTLASGPSRRGAGHK